MHKVLHEISRLGARRCLGRQGDGGVHTAASGWQVHCFWLHKVDGWLVAPPQSMHWGGGDCAMPLHTSVFYKHMYAQQSGCHSWETGHAMLGWEGVAACSIACAVGAWVARNGMLWM